MSNFAQNCTICRFLLATPIPDTLLVNGGGSWAKGMEYLRISGITGSFVLSGASNMTWGAIRPSNSHLADRLQVGRVREPTTFLGMALGASGLVVMRKHRRQKVG